MSFWKETRSAPTWKTYIESWMYSYPSKLVDVSNHLIQKKIPPGFSLRLANKEDIEQLPEFWTRYFSDSTRCIVPLLHIQKMASKSWTILVVVKDDIVVGSLVRRWITNLHTKQVLWKKAGIIDYFCIQPSYRKKGIGQLLLSTIHNLTEKPIQPHLMLLEGLQFAMPPTASGMFLSKQCTHTNISIREVPSEESENAWKICVKGNDVWSDWRENGETSLWNVGGSNCEYVAIWNTFHYSIPNGAKIGIVLGYSSVDVLYKCTLSLAHGFGVLLVGIPYAEMFHFSGWNADSPFQWLSYNLANGFISGKFPALCI